MHAGQPELSLGASYFMFSSPISDMIMRPNSNVSPQIGTADLSGQTRLPEENSPPPEQPKEKVPQLSVRLPASAGLGEQINGSVAADVNEPESRRTDSASGDPSQQPSSEPQLSVRSSSETASKITSDITPSERERIDSLSTEELLVFWTEKAEKGNAEAQYKLGKIYGDGKFVEKNFTEALLWYGKAADQGHKDAQYSIGYLYFYGLGVPVNKRQAASFFRKAAKQDDVNAQFFLADMYRHGEGVARNDRRAVLWFNRAALAGHQDSEYALAEMHGKGRGVQKNLSFAFNTYSKLAAAGYTSAQLKLAEMYARGGFVKQDFAQAAKLYRQAAELGDPLAQMHLSFMYEDGNGVDQDYKEAVRWRLLSQRTEKDTVKEVKFSDSSDEEFIKNLPIVLKASPTFNELKILNLTEFRCSEAGISVVNDLIRSNSKIESISIKVSAEAGDDAIVALIETIEAALRETNIQMTDLTFIGSRPSHELQKSIKGVIQQNRDIRELREYMEKFRRTTGALVPSELQLLLAEQLIIQNIRQGLNKEVARAAVDEFLMSL